jgi:ABC-type multidrug transport system fused ATPase/permease subunit
MEQQNDIKESLKSTIDEIKKYFDLQLEYNKVLTRKKTTEITGKLILSILLLGAFVFVTLFLSLAFVNWYASEIGTRTQGFLIVTLIYLFLALLLYAFRETLIFSPLRRFFIKNFSSVDEKEFFAGRTYADARSTEKYIGFLEKQNKKQEHILQEKLKDVEEHLNWVNITKNAVSSFFQSVSAFTTMFRAAYKFGRHIAEKRRRKKLKERN